MFVGELGNIVFDPKGVPQEDLDNMVQIDKKPQPEEREGYTAKLRANIKTKEVYYEYVKNTEVEELKLLLADATSLLKENGVL